MDAVQRRRKCRQRSGSPCCSSQRNTARLIGMLSASVIASITAKQPAAAKVKVEASPCWAAATKQTTTVAVMRKGSIEPKRR